MIDQAKIMTLVGSATPVYYYEKMAGLINSGRVTDFMIDNGKCYANVKGYEVPGSRYVPMEGLYLWKDECETEIARQEAEQKAAFKASIHSVEDLVRFCFAHTVSMAEEYTDMVAREAAAERAYELLHIKVE